jgi:glycosyltransferase involved in cell wall biosynthesis
MRILVYPHTLSIGGSQLNAIELAAAVRDRGHEVWVFGAPGPLTDHIRELGLPYLPADEAPGPRPSPRLMGRLRQVVHAQHIDVVHAYEWPPALEAFYGPHLTQRVPVLCTVMSMAVAPFLPRSMPLIVGTEQIQAAAASERRTGLVKVLEPPVDTVANHPTIDGTDFRRQLGLDDGRLAVVIVSRLAKELKLEGLQTAIDVAGRLATELPISLVIVGDGPARGVLEAMAETVNRRSDCPVVVLTGPLLDPRPAYAAADVVIGMGGSILRAMAFGKPAIVQGERGFFEVLGPGTAEQFLWQGFYGIGNGEGGQERLQRQLRDLLGDAVAREALGGFARELVSSRFSLERAGGAQEAIYRQVLGLKGTSLSRATIEGVVSGLQVTGHKAKGRIQRWRGIDAVDDFNAWAVLKRPDRHRPEAFPSSTNQRPEGVQQRK